MKKLLYNEEINVPPLNRWRVPFRFLGGGRRFPSSLKRTRVIKFFYNRKILSEPMRYKKLAVILSVIMLFQTVAAGSIVMAEESGSSNSYPVNAKDKNNNGYQKIKTVREKQGSKVLESIKLETYSPNKSSDINTLFPRYKLYNNGNTPIKLSSVKIRYYYTVNGEREQNFFCDLSNIGNGNVTGRFVKIPGKTDGVDYCLEITFKEGAGLLNQNDVVELQCRIEKKDKSEFIQTDDYSFRKSGDTYADYNRVTGYINDKLVYGVEPIAAPLNLKITESDKQITLDWDEAISCTGYEVEADGVLVRNITANTYTNLNLIPGTRHTYRVRLRNAIIAGPWSNYVTGIVPISDKFKLVQTASESAISISWDKIEGARQYFIEVDGDRFDNGQQTSYKIEGLEPGTMKSVRIQAKGDALLGEWSELYEIWTLPEAPESISTSSTKSTITLNWNPVKGAAGYDVEVYGSPEDNLNNTTYTQHDLQSNSQRTYRVRAKNSSGAGQWSELVVKSTLPDSALNMQLQCWDDKLKVTWEAQAGAASYELEIDASQVIELYTNEYLHSDLKPNTTHTYRARPKNENGTGEWSESVTGVTLPSIPADFEVSAVSGSAISLRWGSVEGASGYDIEVDGTVIYNDNKTEFLHDNLGRNEEHIYRVRARNGNVTGEWTEELKKSTLLAAPANLKVTVSGNEVKVEWDMVVGADGYGLEIDGTEIKLDANTEYTQTALDSGIKHTYRVRAYKGSEAGEWSDTSVKTTKIGKPAKLEATTSSSISIDIRWEEVDGATGYDVMADGKIIDNVVTNTYSHTDLAPNSMHTYMVRAKDNENIGDWTDKISAFTNVAAPAGITAVSKSNSIIITWDEVDGAQSYEIMADGNVASTNAKTLYEHTELLPNTQHSYLVRAKNTNGVSDWSTELTQTTGPDVPVSFKADMTINEAILTWLTTSPGADSPETTTQGAISFEIEADGEIISNITELTYKITGLEPNSVHEYRVRAVSEDGVCSEWTELIRVNTKEELVIKVDKDTGFNFVIAVPKKDVSSYDIVVRYNAEDLEVVDLYAVTQGLELETGKIDGTNITIKEFAGGKIVYGVEDADKGEIVIIRFLSKTNDETKMSYTIE